MSDFASLPEEALDRWLADQYRALVNDLTAALDLEAGLREAMIPARHADLVADLRDVLDVEAGLSAIVPATPAPEFEADSEPWSTEESTSFPGSVAVAVRRGSTARVFVSYAGEDRALAGELYRRLVEDGHDVSLDQDRRDGSTSGEEWEQRLSERLRWADATVCLVTSAYLASTWCMAEVGFARSQRSWLLPVWAEPGVDNPPLMSAIVADTDLAQDSVGAALVRTLRHIDDSGGLSWPKDRSPFPGLRPFDTDQHQVFFGRTNEVKQLAELLRSPEKRAEGAALLVVGPSGCGKSSLVRAGLLPLMTYEPGWWTLPSIVPGIDPIAALAQGLTVAAEHIGLEWTVDQVRHRLDKDGLGKLADELLLAAPGGPQCRLLLVVDQFEELLTQTGPTDRARFAELLSAALSGPVHVVATLRPEFLAPLLGDSALTTLPTTIYPLRPLRREALCEVIEGPARLAGIGVDDNLVARLIADTDDGEALPLLAFTLAQLAEGIGHGGQLSAARYDQLGGVQGALTHQADLALTEASAASGRSRAEVIAGLLRLITVDEQGRPTRRRVSRDELPEPVIQEVDAFVARRLVTTDSSNGSVVVEVAHEAFLSAWPPLTQAIEGNASALRARRAVEQAATEWNDKSRPPNRLWERGQLAAALADTGAHLQTRHLVTEHVDLNPKARDFLRASIRRDRFRRRRATAVLSVLLVFAVVAAGFAFIQQRAAEHQRDVALSRQFAGQALELRATNPALAAQLGLAAYRLVPTTEARSSLLSTVANLGATRLTGHTNAVLSVAFSPDGRTLANASADGTVQLWGISDTHHPGLLGSLLTGHASAVNSVAFSPDGHTLATASNDTTARLWDISDPHHPTLLDTLTGHTSAIESVAFSPDGHTLATASDDHTARLWDVTSHQELAILIGYTSAVYGVTFSPNGHTLATASDDKTARLWDISDPHQPHPLSTLTGHTSYVLFVAFSPDGRTLATASDDKTARLWDISDPHQSHPLRTLTGHTEGVRSVAFSPDGHTLATASADHTVILWDLPGPLLAGHSGGVMGMAFSPDGRTLATASTDHTVILWDLTDRAQPRRLGSPLTGHTNTVTSVAFSPDGRTLATASADDTTRLWDIRDPHHPSPLSTLTGHTNTVTSVAFSPDGGTLATGSTDSTARLWDIRDPRQPHPLGILTGHTSGVHSVAFSPDGHSLATTSYDSTQLWDIRDPHHPSPLSTLTEHINTVNSVAFSPDGRTLATASDRTARLWDISDLDHPRSLSTLTGHTNTVNSVAFSPDGRTLATASADDTARLWDINYSHHPSLLGTLTGHTNTVTSVAFSPDGHTLATASDDTTARLWETDIYRVAARICNTTRAITKSEWNQYLPDLPYQPPCS